jgi:DNA invertase Pin-like site-specific DNA recombinase
MWGWAESLIRTIEDLGLSGTTPNRPGYLELLDLIRRSLVGALFLADVTRGGRETREWFNLLNECLQHSVLVVLDGRVYDMKVSGHLLFTRILALLAEYDNSLRSETMRRARRQKAASGLAVTRPPIGYVAGNKGYWELDPYPGAQEAVRAVWVAYQELRSLRRAIRRLREQKVKLIVRDRKNRIREADPEPRTVGRMLRNPAYIGTYRYGVTMSDPFGSRTKPVACEGP